MTRYEAAALLNACLDRVTEVTDELKRLMAEFEKELALLKGRVDGLEAKVGELEASQFSTTTTLGGQATFVLGANRFSGSADAAVKQGNRSAGATTFSYDVQLYTTTSFSGKDSLVAVLRAGNFADSAFGGSGPAGDLSVLEVAFQEDCGEAADCGDVVAIEKLLYTWPLGGGFEAHVGGRIGMEDTVGVWPSVYPGDTVLNVFTVNGAPAAYNKVLGSGGGLVWRSGGFSASASYVAGNGDIGNSSEGGLGNPNSAASGSVQLGYSADQWAVAAIWSRLQAGVGLPGATAFTSPVFAEDPDALSNAIGLGGYWQPASSGWLPSISLGWGLNSTSHDGEAEAGSLRTSQSWMVGLQWSDVISKGNQLGLAVGQPVFATALSGGDTPDDGGVVMEGWYKWQLSDNVWVTPAVFWLSRPLGQLTPAGESFGQLGALVRTTFAF